MEQLSEYDQLLHNIGRAAQAHVNIERSLRDVYIALTSPTLGTYLASSIRSKKLAEDCLLMLKKADIPSAALEAANEALLAAKNSEEIRDRLIHDWWINRLEPGNSKPVLEQHQVLKGSLKGFRVTKRDLSYARNGVRTLVRTYHRINAVNHVLRDELPFYKSAG